MCFHFVGNSFLIIPGKHATKLLAASRRRRCLAKDQAISRQPGSSSRKVMLISPNRRPRLGKKDETAEVEGEREREAPANRVHSPCHCKFLLLLVLCMDYSLIYSTKPTDGRQTSIPVNGRQQRSSSSWVAAATRKQTCFPDRPHHILQGIIIPSIPSSSFRFNSIVVVVAVEEMVQGSEWITKLGIHRSDSR